MKSIETARRDGTRYLLKYKGGRTVVGSARRVDFRIGRDGVERAQLDVPDAPIFWVPDDWWGRSFREILANQPEQYSELKIADDPVVKPDDDYERGVAAGGG